MLISVRYIWKCLLTRLAFSASVRWVDIIIIDCNRCCSVYELCRN
jgi:hypothetical protein